MNESINQKIRFIKKDNEDVTSYITLLGSTVNWFVLQNIQHMISFAYIKLMSDCLIHFHMLP